ncbi:MAG: tetratricopeptide repeat protein [Sorangiineae bacterium PRO1]|nr:tetratricopeptide repeat protein [Sorangiineae bacterium PRO1]
MGAAVRHDVGPEEPGRDGPGSAANALRRDGRHARPERQRARHRRAPGWAPAGAGLVVLGERDGVAVRSRSHLRGDPTGQLLQEPRVLQRRGRGRRGRRRIGRQLHGERQGHARGRQHRARRAPDRERRLHQHLQGGRQAPHAARHRGGTRDANLRVRRDLAAAHQHRVDRARTEGGAAEARKGHAASPAWPAQTGAQRGSAEGHRAQDGQRRSLGRQVKRLLVALLAAHLLCSAGPAVAKPDQPSAADDAKARSLFKQGDAAYAEGRYEDALGAFEEAYRLSHRPRLMFNIGNALERLGKLSEAADALEKYLPHAKPTERDVLSKRVQNLRKRAAPTSTRFPATMV